MNHSDLRLAFIGCGNIARRHVVAMKDLISRDRGGFQVVALCDANLESAHNLAQEVKDQLGGDPTVYSSYEEM
ncbi:MAG: Gfo/Idh/MocA family oxidoreductase, partial [Anaerolineaceae bacterium]|nr:Gfo/Idh/MocA family oxidoreductase [Anaerolineaceae bacterium]